MNIIHTHIPIEPKSPYLKQIKAKMKLSMITLKAQ